MPSTCKATHSPLKSLLTHPLQFGQFGDSAGVCDCMWLHVCTCVHAYERGFLLGVWEGSNKELEGVKSRRAPGGGGGGGLLLFGWV